MRILVIYNNDALVSDDEDNSHLCLESRGSIKKVAGHVANVLNQIDSYQTIIEPLSHLKGLVPLVSKHQPQLVFNLCESLAGDANAEIEVAKQLEALKLPFTGNASQALNLCLDKYLCNQLLFEHDLPVPYSKCISRLEDLEDFQFKHQRYIVKPNDEDGSTGIDQCSVVHTMTGLIEKVEQLQRYKNQRLLIQEFIEGREINVTFIGHNLTPHWSMSEIEFSTYFDDKPKILTYRSKWVENSPEFQGTTSTSAKINEEMRFKLFNIVEKGCQKLGLNGYGRFDFKLSDNMIPYIIDVNPNCDLDPNAGFSRASSFNNINYHDLIHAIVQHTLRT